MSVPPPPPLSYAGLDPTALTTAELAALADSFYGLDKRIAQLNREVADARSERAAIRALLLAAMRANGNLVTIGGSVAAVTRSKSRVAKVTDWPALWAHIQRTGEFDLLHKRVTDTSVAERWDNGVEVPGVEREEVETLSVTTVLARKARST